MNQARKDTSGIKLEVNERFVLSHLILTAASNKMHHLNLYTGDVTMHASF